jgi:hypothetical protein
VILDTKGNIFGGFTPLKWESGNSWRADDSLKSFLFTLKNPHNIPARRFALKAEEKHLAIICYSHRGPDFPDMAVSDNCNADIISATSLDKCYINNTGLDKDVVFTGSMYFQVEEIEVFEIKDSTTLHSNLLRLRKSKNREIEKGVTFFYGRTIADR